MVQFGNPEGVCKFPGMSHYAKIGNILLIGGQVSVNESGELIGKNDPAAQARQVFQNLETILTACGASKSNIVKLNTYLTDSSHRSATKAVRQEFLGQHCPVTTGFSVKELASPDFLIEVEAIAVLDEESCEE